MTRPQPTPKETTMPRTPEAQAFAYHCLALAVSNSYDGRDPVEIARRFYAFVTGEDMVDAALDTLRQAAGR